MKMRKNGKSLNKAVDSIVKRKVESIERISDRIVGMMRSKGVDSVKFDFDGHGIVLDSCGENGNGELENYEVFTLYSSMNADTNIGSINILQDAPDEDDLYTLEDAVKDALGIG